MLRCHQGYPEVPFSELPLPRRRHALLQHRQSRCRCRHGERSHGSRHQERREPQHRRTQQGSQESGRRMPQGKLQSRPALQRGIVIHGQQSRRLRSRVVHSRAQPAPELHPRRGHHSTPPEGSRSRSIRLRSLHGTFADIRPSRHRRRRSYPLPQAGSR